MRRAAALAALAARADGHGAVVRPPPRNGVDRDLSPWSGAVPAKPPSVESMTGWCPVPGADGKPSGQNGQSCFWFSNGCALGCDTCDGTSRGPIPWKKGDPHWDRKFNLCNTTEKVATICDPALRTVNTGVECGADDDWYYYSPWRAPGAAPVFDSCGMAGGHVPPQGGFGGIYVNTTHATLGDYGSKVLPKYPTDTVWAPGNAYEVTWSIEANHAGGYQYRLCPADQTLDEACFQKTPLAFVGPQGFRWGGGPKNGGSELFFNGTYVSGDLVKPAGSTWVTNPVPRNDGVTGQGFPPRCPNTKEQPCQGMTDGSSADPILEIVDYVMIPKDLPEGEYVLGWRWDCEESNQIWQSCSDVTVSAAAPAPPPLPTPPPPSAPTPPPASMCGASVGNNYGTEMPDMPIPAADRCDCAGQCATTEGCAGWTYWPDYKPEGSCWLRSDWGKPVDNCGTGCWSAKRPAKKMVAIA